VDFYAIPPSLPSTVYTIVHIHSSYKCLVRKEGFGRDRASPGSSCVRGVARPLVGAGALAWSLVRALRGPRPRARSRAGARMF